MEVMSVGQLKTHFSQVLKRVLAGEEIGIAYGKNKDIVARIVPKKSDQNNKRKIGLLDNKATVSFGPDFKMTEEEFLGL